MPQKYTLLLDDPSMYLDDRGNPRTGRHLVFQGPDDTRFELQVTMAEYADPKAIQARLAALVKTHQSLGEIEV